MPNNPQEFVAEEDVFYRKQDGRRFRIVRAGQRLPWDEALRRGLVAPAHVPADMEYKQREDLVPEQPRYSVAGEEPLPEGEIDATDAARELADEYGVDLAFVEGTGEDGRVLKGDVEAAIEDVEKQATTDE